jgi:hypothetical protein
MLAGSRMVQDTVTIGLDRAKEHISRQQKTRPLVRGGRASFGAPGMGVRSLTMNARKNLNQDARELLLH